MSTWFTQNLWMFGKIAIVLSAAIIIVEAIIWVRKNPISWRVPGGSRLTGGIQSMWNTHGVATLKSLALISACLFFINMLCAQTGYEWWKDWRNESGLFWTAQFALVFSCYILMTRASWIAKLMAVIVIGIVISGIVRVVNSPTVLVKAGTWHEIVLRRNSTTSIEPINPEPGTTCIYMVNDDPRQWKSPDDDGNRTINLSEEKLGVTIVKIRVMPDKDARFAKAR